jgi:hypothetical protein
MTRNRTSPDAETYPEADDDVVRATARLRGLDIEIVRRNATDDDAELISIHLRAAPASEAFTRAFEIANPFTFWARAAAFAWQPWLGAARIFALPWMVPALPSSEEQTTDAHGDGTSARLSRSRDGVIPDIQ